MHFVTILLTAAAVATSARSTPNTLMSRALPPCKGCAGNPKTADSEWLASFKPASYESQDPDQVYPALWLPNACYAYGYVCYALGTGMKFVSGGINSPEGTFTRDDGTTVTVWRYWQSTLQFVGNLATVNSYPAHCDSYTFAKGPAARFRVGNGPTIVGDHTDKIHEQCPGNPTLKPVGKAGLIKIWLGGHPVPGP